MSLDDMIRLGPLTADDTPLGLQGIDEQPDQMGLGLASDPNAAALQEGQVPGWVTALKGISGAIEAFGAGVQGRTPLFMLQQQQDNQRLRFKEAADQRRQEAAQRVEALAETKRQHNWGIAESLISSGNMDALEKFGEQFPDVIPIVQGIAKQDLADLPKYVERGYVPKEFVERMMNPKPGEKPPTAGEIRGYADMAKTMFKEDVKAEAKQHQLELALNTPEDQRRPSQRLMVEEHKAALDLKKTDAKLKESQTRLNDAYAKQGGRNPDRSLANKQHMSLFGVPFEQGDEASQQAALEAYYKGSAQGRQTVTENIPVGQTGKAQELRDPVTGKAAPSWATPKQLSDLGYVNIEPSQISTVTQLQNVDASMKEILASGSTLLRKETGSGNLFEIPFGMVQTPILKLIKKYAGDPDAALLQSAINRITPTLSKLGGDVANVAVAERELYAQAIFNDADTLESFTKKIKSITDAQVRTRESMGFLPDEKSYMRRLIIEGKSDEQIKAIIAERKRFQ